MKHAIGVVGVVLLVTALSVPAVQGESHEGLQEKLVKMEKAMWQAWADATAAVFEEGVTDDYRSVGPWGRQTKAEFLESLGECEVESFSLAEFDLVMIDDTTALLTYEAEQDAVCEGEKIPSKIVSSSVWVERDGKWLAALYHEAPVAADDM